MKLSISDRSRQPAICKQRRVQFCSFCPDVNCCDNTTVESALKRAFLFHRHVASCKTCYNDPFTLCDVGRLLRGFDVCRKDIK